MPKTQNQPSKQLAPSELDTVQEKYPESEISAKEVTEKQQTVKIAE